MKVGTPNPKIHGPWGRLCMYLSNENPIENNLPTNEKYVVAHAIMIVIKVTKLV